MGRTNPYRHPLGRRCGDPRTLGLVLLLMPWAMLRYSLDVLRGRG